MNWERGWPEVQFKVTVSGKRGYSMLCHKKQFQGEIHSYRRLLLVLICGKLSCVTYITELWECVMIVSISHFAEQWMFEQQKSISSNSSIHAAKTNDFSATQWWSFHPHSLPVLSSPSLLLLSLASCTLILSEHLHYTMITTALLYISALFKRQRIFDFLPW